MTDNVNVDQGEHSQQDAATLLLAAAEELGLDPGVVRLSTSGSGPGFNAPEDVVKKAGLKAEKVEEEEVSDKLEGPTPEHFAKQNSTDDEQDKPAAKKSAVKTPSK